MFKNVDVIYSKSKGIYSLRLATPAESAFMEKINVPRWKTGLSQEEYKELQKQKIKCFENCVIYPPEYTENTVKIQGDKLIAGFDFKTGKGKLFIKGMNGYGGHNDFQAARMYGIDFNFSPEIITAVLNELPSKGTLHDTKHGVSIQY